MIILMLFLSLFVESVAAEEKTAIRVGHFPTITHGQGLIGHGLTRQNKGWFEQWLGPEVDIQWMVYDAGPSAMEAMFADALDLTYIGPGPTINAYLKSEGQLIRIVCGACSKGAALVVLPGRIKELQDFIGKKIATPQFGNTQDVAARSWLQSKGFQVSLTGGDVMVIPIEGSSQLILLKQEDLDGAWNVEPWISRFVLEAGAEVYLNESELWPQTGGEYVTAHLVCSQKFIDKHPDLLKKWIAAHIELTAWINTHPDEAKEIANAELEQETKRKLSPEVLKRAWEHIHFTYAPIRASLIKNAEQAYDIGFLKEKPNLKGIYDLRFLKEILSE